MWRHLLGSFPHRVRTALFPQLLVSEKVLLYPRAKETAGTPGFLKQAVSENPAAGGRKAGRGEESLQRAPLPAHHVGHRWGAVVSPSSLGAGGVALGQAQSAWPFPDLDSAPRY